MKILRLFPFHHAVWLFGLLLTGLLASPARAQGVDESVDPPARVGRLAEVQGEVWVFDNEEGEWIQASRNRPVTVGDRLSSSRDSRAEARIGSTTVRIDANTEVEVTALDDDRISLRLHSGDMAVRLRTREAARAFELVTPEGSFRPDRAGSYRFSRDDDTTEATASSGQLELRAPDAGVTIQAGQRYRFWQDKGTQFESVVPRRDAFDEWVASRDDREDRSVSARYVSPEMTGVEDLDRYGRWEQDPEYGALWIPQNVSPGWAPYRVGHWVWISPWGWTWVDDAPWGFAPFHYGRWVSRGNEWCWTPGRYVARPVYAPALVAWIGGSGGSVAIQSRRHAPSTVGWFPLGPREVYVPGHRFTPRYMRHVNDNQVPNGFNYSPIIRDPRSAVEHGRYRYRAVAHAVTIVPRQVVERRQPVRPAIIGMHGRALPGSAVPRPDAPVMPGGRSPSIAPRPVFQTAIPAAPGALRERFGSPQFGRGDRQHPREPDHHSRDNTPLVSPATHPNLGGRRDDDPVRPGVRPGFPIDSTRPSPLQQPQSQQQPPQPASPRDDRWRQLRPAAQQPEPQQPAPRADARSASPNSDAHRPGGFNHMRPHPQPNEAESPRPQPVAPQVQAPQVQQPHVPPPQFQHARPQPTPTPTPAPAPQVQAQVPRPQPAPPSPAIHVQRPPPQPVPQVQQPQPQAQPAPQRPAGGAEQHRDERPVHRRME